MSSTTIAVFDIAATRPCRSVAVVHAAASVPPVCVFSVIVSPTSTADEVVENDGRRPVPLAPDVKRLLYHARAAGMSDVRTRRSLSRRLASMASARLAYTPSDAESNSASRNISAALIPAGEANPRICLADELACRTSPFAVKNRTPHDRFESTAALIFSEVFARRLSNSCRLWSSCFCCFNCWMTA